MSSVHVDMGVAVVWQGALYGAAERGASMTHQTSEHHFDTVVVGGGQAGLAMGYFLAQQEDRDFVILDASDRVGDVWRNRWDSLRLFTPAFHSGLPGMPFPAPGRSFPAKDETADYLETYARTFDLPLRLGRRVESLSSHDEGYLVRAGGERYLAEHVVVATGPYHHPNIPGFAAELDPAIAQLHSSAYRNPSQLPEGGVLVVGAGNSGAEIAVELAASRSTYLSGRDTGHLPVSLIHNRLTLWLADHAFTIDTRLGRKMSEAMGRRGDPLVRLKAKDIAVAGVERVPRVDGIVDGKPRLADGRGLDVAVVVWATGFRPDFGWIELPIFDEAGYPIHHRGVVDTARGLYFLGLPFQYTPTSTHVGGVGKDARYVADTSSPTPANPGVDRDPRPLCSHPLASRLQPANDPERVSRKEVLTMYDLASYVWVLVLAGAIGIPAATCAVLYRSAVAAGVGRRAATAVTATTAAVLGGWLVISGLLARAGVYRQDPGEVVPWLGVMVAGTLIALLLVTRIPLVSRILAAPGTPARLVLPHALRIVGVLFVIVMAQGHLPAAFALPASLGDIAIGVAAPFVARRLARDTDRTGAVRFHVLGILDLIVAGSIGFLLLGLVEVTPSTAPLLVLPLALILTVPVPLALALHIVSLRRLGTAAKPEKDRAGHVPAAG